MQKFFIITAFVLLSSVAVAAQTVSEQKPNSDGRQVDFAKRVETGRSVNAPVVSVKAKQTAERTQVLRIVDGRVLRLGPTTIYLKNGLSIEEVVRLLGQPTAVSKRQEGGMTITTCTFSRSEGRVFVTEFENGLLTSSRTEIRKASGEGLSAK
jgi:hypothetical protein